MTFAIQIFNDLKKKITVETYECENFALGDVLLSSDSYDHFERDTEYTLPQGYLNALKNEINERDFYIHFAKCLFNLIDLMNKSGTGVILQDRRLSKVSIFEKLLSGKQASHHAGAFGPVVAEMRSLLDKGVKGSVDSGLSQSLCHFSSFLRVHEDFYRVMSGKNQRLFDQISLITAKKQASRFDCYCIIDLISQLDIPGISNVKIYSTLSEAKQRIEKIDFPLNLIPERYRIIFVNSKEPDDKQFEKRQEVINHYYTQIQLWLKKAEYVHRVFQKNNINNKHSDIPNYGMINDLLDEETVSLNEFSHDLSYRMARANEGFFVSKPAKGRLFTKKLPPLHRCLLMIEQQKNASLPIHPDDLNQLRKLCTPLYLSAWLGDLSAVNQAIQEGIDLNEKDKTNKTALMVAIQRNHVEIVKTLIRHGAENPYRLQTNNQIREELGKINPQMFLVLREPIVNGDAFNEVVRRIPKAVLSEITQALTEVTPEQLAQLHVALKDPAKLLHPTSFIHDDIFPMVALKAFTLNEITVHEFGTLMRLWGSVSHILPKPGEVFTLPEFIPLIQSNGEPNPRAVELLSQSLSLSQLSELSVSLALKHKMMDGIMNRSHSLSTNEQGFWLVTNTTNKFRYKEHLKLDSVTNKEQLHVLMVTQTIAQAIKKLGVRFLHYTEDVDQEIIPSFGLEQLLLDVISSCSVKLNPVIGASSPHDTRLGDILRYRDIALPFPGIPLPKMADGYPSPSTSDFMFHDYYHAIRASIVPPEETAYYIAIGDYLENMQSTFNQAAKQFSVQHERNKRMIPAFFNKIQSLSPYVQEQALRMLAEKFKNEYVIIETLKKLRKHTGQLKFIMYDMEHPGMFSGGLQGSTYDPVVHMLKGMQNHIIALNARYDAHTFGHQTNSVICHAMIHAMMLDTSRLSRAAQALRGNSTLFSAITGSELRDFMDKAIEKEIGPRLNV
ncbi:MAG: ankyrin repeat domain-containing protein [Legionellaceae bacterium]|nr:ankyrin repeat domain-containing protein [Legionellaceae bacterium]